jgi:Tol biopolymer transport system component/tRNA A-37 threonylcarbamoyl transferase component Bud32
VADQTPPRIGRYEIQAAIGAGGMGRVYRARDTLLHRDVALKLLVDVVTDEARSRLINEARAASCLNHPSICQIYDAGDSPEGPWIAMEFVRGESLDRRIPPNGLEYEQALRLALDITAALRHAHERGIVHRDLKPGNIVWSDDGAIKVLDFGLARMASREISGDSTMTAVSDVNTIAGTPAYLAPEVIRGRQADTRSDLWALGVMFYEIVSGSRPFSGRSSLELVSTVVTDPPRPLPESVPAPFAAIVLRLLEKDPARRYQSVEEVVTALESLRTTVELPTVITAPPRSARVRTIVPLALIAGGIVVALWWTRDGRMQLTNIQPLTGPEVAQTAPTLSPDGGQLAFVAPDSRGVPQVWVRTFADQNAIQITSGDRAAARPQWRPDGSAIVYALRGAGVWSVPPVGGAPLRLVSRGVNPSLARNGERLAWEDGDELWIARSDGSSAHVVAGVPARYYSVPRLPSLSPDGKHIVFFQAQLGPHGDFWAIPSDGGEARQLTFDLRPGGASAWTPDGSRIIFSSGRAGTLSLWQMPARGGEPTPLTTGAGEDNWPAISADGSRLVFTNVRNSWDLRLRDSLGADRSLLRRSTEILFPRVSPDGSQIAFFGTSGFAVAVWTIRKDGSEERQLTAGRELNHMPRWWPDGESLLFYQSAPDIGVRRIPSVGGPSTPLLPFQWEKQNALEVDSLGTRIVYTLAESKEAATIIRHLATGDERKLQAPRVLFPRFSHDGTRIAGSTDQGHLVVCRLSDLRCAPSAAIDWTTNVAWSGDDSRIYFLRGQDRGSPQQVWSIGVDTGDERRHGEIGPFRGIDRFFDLSPSGEIVWAPFSAGRSEMWAATIK